MMGFAISTHPTHYGYDALDRLVSKHHSLQTPTGYRYDETGRIVSCRNDGYHDAWQYDAAANLVQRPQGREPQEKSQTIRFNRVLSFTHRRYEYDVHGRMTLRDKDGEKQHLKYDVEHRLTEVRIKRTGMREQRYGYEYDALGRRTAKYQIDADGQKHSRTTFLWDGMRMVREQRVDGSTLYVYNGVGSYEPLARLDTERATAKTKTLYYHTDVNGAPEELTDVNGKIVWRTEYQVWGNMIIETDRRDYEPRQNLRFQGQYLDRETGLHYNLNRYYDPDTGRFITPDPIGLAGGLNLYAYAPDPVNWIDPWGLSAASDLPQLQGKSVAQINQILSDSGFRLDKQTSTGNQTWSHADGSQARVDPYGNESMTMKNGQPLPKSGANAHVHKYGPGKTQLNDRGISSNVPNETHIGIKNPADYPSKRGRAHGCGA